MKITSGKSESKKRKRDDSQETISESPKRTKVHAQRKFAQGAAFNTPVITPIKDKARPTASLSTPGPMLTNKRPNTEDFLTFLCFRRTSILPPKLDFFKDAAGNQNVQSDETKSSGSQKANAEQPTKQNSKKSEKKEENKKNQPAAVQALRKKYQEQRLAKQKPTNVTKLAQKVKGKNMMRTRSATLVEEKKPASKKEPVVKVSVKEAKGKGLGLRSGLQRNKLPDNKKTKTPVKNKNVRSGLRSSAANKANEKETPEPKPAAKKPETVKKVKIDVETAPKRTKKTEGFSDFSSDDNEPLLAVKKLKTGKKVIVKEEKKPAPVKTRSQNADSDSPQPRPTRKTKEAAAIYMEMITKKLVSPDKSGDDDISSVDSFPELPNAKRNEQRESEIKAKALATKKEQKRLIIEEAKKMQQQKKMEAVKKPEANKSVKEDSVKKSKKEEKVATVKKAAKKEEPAKKEESEEKEKVTQSDRRSTRSKRLDDLVFKSKTIDELSLKKSKLLVKKAVQKRTGAKPIIQPQPVKKAKVINTKEDSGKRKASSVGKKETKADKAAKKPAEKGKNEKEKAKDEKEEKPEKGNKGAKAEKAEKAEKKEKIEKAEKVTKQDKIEKSEKVSKQEKSEKVAKQDKTDKSEKATKQDKLEKSEKTKQEKAEKSEKVTKKEKAENSEKPPKQEKIEKVGKAEKVDKSEKVTKGEKAEKSEKNTKAEKADKIGKAEKVEKASKAEKVEKSEKGAKQDKAVEKIVKPEKIEKAAKTEKPEKVEKAVTKNENNEKLSRQEKDEKVKKPQKEEQDAKPEKNEKPKKIEKTPKSEKPEKVTKTEKKEKDHSPEPEKMEEPSTLSKRPTRKCSTADKIWIDIDGFTSDEEDFIDMRSITTSRSSKKDESSKQEVKKKAKTSTPKETQGKKKTKKETPKEKENDAKKKNKEDTLKETDAKKETKVEETAKNKKEVKQDKKPEPETSKKKEEPKKRASQNKTNEKPTRKLRKQSSSKSESDSSSDEKEVRRTRPIRQCSTGDKMWIESDNSDSFDYYASSSDEDNVPIVDINKKEKPAEKAKPDPVPEPKSTPSVLEKPKDKAEDCDNFSESDEEPLKKKAEAKVEEVKIPVTKPMPELHPIKRDVMKTPEKPLLSPKQITPPVKSPEPKNVESKPENPVFHKPEIFEPREKPVDIPVVCSVPNRIEMILQTLKSDKRMETTCTSTVSHMSSPIITDPKITYQIPTTVVCTFPPRSLQRPREPINTHGLDLLSEVALPKSKDVSNLQTERIEKWLNDSLAAEKKETFPVYEEVKYKSPPKPPMETYLTTVPKASHQELRKFEQFEQMESQKLKRKPETPKKTVTSVQDLLKLQKERKEVPKQLMMDNTPHSKNCQCNSCVVKKGWFKNKPIPKAEELKVTTADMEKPFESLSKAFVKSPKMSVSVAPIMHSASTSTMTRSPEKKPIFQQRKLSFLERMKERERKEALVKASPNAFSPNNESSVYAFEPEPEPTSTPFRSKTRDSRTSSTNTSKSEDDVLKICEDEVSQVSSGTQVDKKSQDSKISPKVSASIAVQVNLDNESTSQVEAVPETLEKSIEISTQTEVPEEDSDSPMFYIPLQQTTATTCVSDQQLIQGVALKLGTEGPVGPNQRVIMKAKLVTKPQDMKAVVMPQPKRLFDQKINNPPVGTVQPTTRKPPEILSDESNTIKSVDSDFATTTTRRNKNDPEFVSQASTDSGMGSEVSSLKTNLTSPSSSKLNKSKEKVVQSGSREHLDESSPSSSKAKRLSKQKSSEAVINRTSSAWMPPPGAPSKLVEAPVFYPTEKEFTDPIEFFDRIRPEAEKFGLCRIVPPSNFKPDCKVTDDMRFTAYNQYVHRMLHRWGPNVKEMMAIKKYLATQSISLKQPPWIGGIEVDLPRLYQSVQNCGGLMKVMEKKKWHQVADMMKIPKAAQDRVTKLDDIYCKYLLPYDTLSHDERQKLFDEVEKDWLDRQKSSEESQDSQTDEESEEENYIDECEECIAKGRNMALNQFYRIARNTMSMWFKNSEPTATEVENEFWKHVNERNHHVCVHSGSIDSSGWGYGFPIGKNNTFSKHPWNLKVLTNNSGSILRSLGPVMGVTVPTLHVGMVFTAFCWYRDPHGLPWIEYLHTGAPKKWYGISHDNSAVFREAVTKLLPRYIKNKTVWLPSDTAMVPPNLLVEHGVSLCHTIQEPGQFILVFPRAYTSSICTGYLVSESVYFAQPSWLTTAEQAFKDIQDSCEPTMFSLEKLLFSIANDSRSSVDVLKQVLPMVWHIRQKEIDGRKTLFNLGLKTSERLHVAEFGSKKKKGRWAQDDDGDYECEICRTNLYVSLVTNSHEEGVYCLPHAIELLTQKRHHLKYCKLMYSFSQEEMNELVEKLEQRIENKTQKKLQGKSAATPK